MGRTLYLNENSGTMVVRDGPSVLVKSESIASRRVPARLLSRAVIIGNVRLEAGVITLFTEYDIPVVFLNGRGDEVAVAIPYNHKLARHYERQKIFLESDEHVAKYENWANTKRMTIQVKVIPKLRPELSHIAGHGIGEGNYQILLSKMKPAEEKWQLVSGVVNNLFRGLIVEHLLKADLDPHLGVIHRRHNFGFALDICYILGAESDMQCIQFFRQAAKTGCILKTKDGCRLTDEGMRSIIHRFENRRIVIHNKVNSVIDELFELIRELKI